MSAAVPAAKVNRLGKTGSWRSVSPIGCQQMQMVTRSVLNVLTTETTFVISRSRVQVPPPAPVLVGRGIVNTVI